MRFLIHCSIFAASFLCYGDAFNLPNTYSKNRLMSKSLLQQKTTACAAFLTSAGEENSASNDSAEKTQRSMGSLIKVVNLVKAPKNLEGVYIGRKTKYQKVGSPLGNPFKMKGEKDRDDVVEKYENWLQSEMEKDTSEAKSEILRLANIVRSGKATLNIKCYCAPKRCHGDIVKQTIEEVLRGDWNNSLSVVQQQQQDDNTNDNSGNRRGVATYSSSTNDNASVLHGKNSKVAVKQLKKKKRSTKSKREGKVNNPKQNNDEMKNPQNKKV